MADMNFTVDANVNPAIRNLDKLNNRVEKLDDSFKSLRGALAGLALGAFATSAIKFADSMQDLANASGVAVNNIVGLTKTFQANGGSAEQAQNAIIKLSLSIADAAEGSKNAQLAFQSVGVSLNDIATLSEQDILAKTIQGLAKITDVSLRTKTAVELLGRGAKGIDFTGVAAGYTKASDEAKKYNEAIAKSAALNDKLEAAIGKVKLSFLQTFAPLADAINKIPDDKLNQLIDSFVQMAAALVTLAAAAKTLSLLGQGIAFVAGAWASFTLGASMAAAGLVKLTGGVTTIINLFKNLGMLLILPFTTFAGVLGRVVTAFRVLIGSGSILITAFGAIAAGLARMIPIVAIVSTAFFGLSQILKAFTGKGIFGWIDTGIDKLKTMIGLASGTPTPATGGMSDAENAAEIKRQQNRAAAAAAAEQQKQKLREVQTYYEQQKKSLESNTAEFKRQGNEIVKNLQLELLFNGVSEDTVEIIKAQNDAYKRAADEIQKLKDQKAALKPEEAQLAALIDQQIVKIQRLGQEQANQSVAAIQQLQLQRDAQDRLNHSLEMKSLAIKDDESLLQLQEQLNLVGQYGDQLQNNLIKLDVERELRGKLNDYAIKELELINQKAKLGEENFNREMAQLEALRQAALGYANARLAAENKIVDATRKSEREDVGGAIKKRLDELQRSVDPAVLAVQKVDSVFGNMNSALDDFVKTGKFKFKDFARSVIQDLIAIELKATATKLLSNIIGSFGSILGFANGGNPPVNKPSIVGERGPELFVPKQAGTIIPNGQFGMGGGGGPVTNNYITNNISALDAKSVAQLFAENRKTLFGAVEMAKKETPYRTA